MGDEMSDDEEVWDVVIIGSGCSGLSCAKVLLERGARVLVLDEGRSLEARDRNHVVDSAAGVGGAGLFSDGKFSFWPSGQQFNLHLGPSQLAEIRSAFDECLRLLVHVGLPAIEFPQDAFAQPDPLNLDWKLKSYPSFYLNLEQRSAVVRDLYRTTESHTWLGHSVERVDLPAHPGHPFSVHLAPRDDTVALRAPCVRARRLVLASGRFGMRLPGLEPLRTRFRRFEFGLRIQIAHENEFFRRYTETDLKLICQASTGVQYRTFCVCRRGELVATRLYGLSTMSGRADCEPTAFSNFGLLCRITDLDTAARVAPAVLAAAEAQDALFSRPLHIALSDPAALNSLLGAEAGQLMREGLTLLVARYPELSAAEAVVCGPAVEGTGHYCDLLPDLSVRGYPGLSVIGDASGVFRGIVPSMVSGYYAGRQMQWSSVPCSSSPDEL
jgi:uncharacterized FAD-dependent dehydrogenase